MRDSDDINLAKLTPERRRNLHNTMIGCVALPIIGYGIVRLLIHLLA